MSIQQPDRRGTYITFQAVLSGVLILYLLYNYELIPGWQGRLAFLVGALGMTFIPLIRLPWEKLSTLWFQAGLFLADVVLASLTLLWTGSPQSDLYLIYFLIILGTTLTRNYQQSFVVALAASLFYIFLVWDPHIGFPTGTRFWLRIPYLWIMAAISAAISLDARRSQKDQERRYQKRLVQMERLAAVGQLAGEVAHRIKGPLSTILVNAELLSLSKKGAKPPPKVLGEIREAVEHCRKTLDGLLDLGRVDESRFGRLKLGDVLREALASSEVLREKSGVRLETAGLDAPARVVGDGALLYEAFYVLLQNAIEAMPDGGTLSVSLRPVRRGSWWLEGMPPQRGFEIAIIDTGVGIRSEDIDRIFQPFFTTKKEGNGLGLSAALRILQSHEGSIDASSSGPGAGSRLLVFLPRE